MIGARPGPLRRGDERLPLFKRKPQSFNLQIQDILLRVTAPEEYYEECRAAALSVWEQLSAYSVRDPRFRTSKRPVEVPEQAAPLIREMATPRPQAVLRPARRPMRQPQAAPGPQHWDVARRGWVAPLAGIRSAELR